MTRSALLSALLVTLTACASGGDGDVRRTTVLNEAPDEERGDSPEKIAMKKQEIEREIAENAGLLGAMQSGELEGVFGSSSLDSNLTGGIGGLIGAKGVQVGGLGLQGTGRGGGGSAENIGGLAIKGSVDRSTSTKPSVQLTAQVSTTRGPGTLDPAIIQRVVRRHRPRLKYCVAREEARDKSASGVTRYKASFAITIDAQGQTTQITPSGSDLKPKAEACVVNTLKRMRFPSPKGGAVEATLDVKVESEPPKDKAAP